MALQGVGTIWAYKNRGCVVTGHGTKTIPAKGKHQKALTWNVNRVTFLDGNQPVQLDIAEKDFVKNSRPLKGGTLDYFRRVYELKTQGMMVLEAVQQAKAELAKGIGREPEGVREVNG